MEVEMYRDILISLRDRPFREKQIRTAGVISEYVRVKHGIELVVVGGLSVEIYTDGGYATQDIDFVGVGHGKITAALKDLGFISHGKDSIHEELQIYVEIPSSVLKDSDQSYVKTIKTSDGFTLSIIGIEDIIKDRIRALLYFKEYNQGKWIHQLIKNHVGVIDVSYIEHTLDNQERNVFREFLTIAQEVNKNQVLQYKLIQFLDEKEIPYTLVNDTIISLATNDKYYGLSLFPYIMTYYYEDDIEEYFIPAHEDPLTFAELVIFLKQIKISELKKIRELIEFVVSLEKQ